MKKEASHAVQSTTNKELQPKGSTIADGTVSGEISSAITLLERPDSTQLPNRRATGPQTKIGKQQSRKNATKHGIFSSVILLPGEPQKDYEVLLNQLQEALGPEGRLEELLIEKLASLAWRHRRLLVAEGAEIRNASEFREWDEQNESLKTEREDRASRIFYFTSKLIQKIDDPDILIHCLDSLGRLRQAIESRGFNKDVDTPVLETVYGSGNPGRQTLYECYLEWADTAEVLEEERQREGYATPQQCKENVLVEIDQEIQRLRKYQRKAASVKSERTKLSVLQRSIPEPPKLDRLLRYEAHLERIFDRTLNQLERMQRLRRGQPVPPRIDVNVSTEAG